ncbi:MAG: hypothetical protein AB1630_00820 [bacterium]
MIKKETIYILFMFIFLIILTEFLSLFYLKTMDMTKGDISTRHLYHPYRGHQLNPEYSRKWDTNGQKIHSIDGFRNNHPISKIRKANTFRIIMMGASALYGIGVQKADFYPKCRGLLNNETINYFLENILNEELKKKNINLKVEVINAAVTGYQTFQHLIYFNECLYEYSPDMVIFFDGHNDFYNTKKLNHFQDYSYSSVYLIPGFNNRGLLFTLYTTSRYLSKFSYFFKVVEKVVEKIWERKEVVKYSSSKSPVLVSKKEEEFPNNYKDIARDTFLRAYLQFQCLSKLYNFDIMVFLQPEVILENDNYLSKEDALRKEITLKQGFSLRIENIKIIRQLLPDIFKKYSIDFYDISTIGSVETKKQHLYMDYCHLTPIGSKRVAELMAPIILSKLKK